MAAIVSTTAPLMAWEYELLAMSDTVAGEVAWNNGNYPRAIAMWKSAARWVQFARALMGSV